MLIRSTVTCIWLPLDRARIPGVSLYAKLTSTVFPTVYVKLYNTYNMYMQFFDHLVKRRTRHKEFNWQKAMTWLKKICLRVLECKYCQALISHQLTWNGPHSPPPSTYTPLPNFTVFIPLSIINPIIIPAHFLTFFYSQLLFLIQPVTPPPLSS